MTIEEYHGVLVYHSIWDWKLTPTARPDLLDRRTWELIMSTPKEKLYEETTYYPWGIAETSIYIKP